jgi:hypothetical protein
MPLYRKVRKVITVWRSESELLCTSARVDTLAPHSTEFSTASLLFRQTLGHAFSISVGFFWQQVLILMLLFLRIFRASAVKEMN